MTPGRALDLGLAMNGHFIAPADEAAVYLHPGHLYVTAGPATITTILGSCVTVCLFDARSRIGGANHFLLPQHAHDGAGAERYGPVAMRRLLDEVVNRGARQRDLTAYVAGGACVLATMQTVINNLGQRNIDTAREFLADAQIRIIGESVGGIRGRKLVFSTTDGSVSVKVIGT